MKHKLRLFEFLAVYNSVVQEVRVENGGALVAIFAPQVIICGADTLSLGTQTAYAIVLTVLNLLGHPFLFSICLDKKYF